MHIKYIAHSIQDTKTLAKHIAKLIKQEDLFYLNGELGSGKTTLVQFIIHHFNSKAQVVSPTFSLIQSYDSPIGDIYHIDLYRIESELEIQNLGLEEIFNFHPCFVEWASKLGKYQFQQEAFINITIKNLSTTTKEFTLDIPEQYKHYTPLATLLKT